jgi:hypothetical protein
MAQNDRADYTYKDAGFSAFLRRSIDSPTTPAATLQQYARNAQQTTRAINFDNAPVSGQLSEITRVGDSIVLDGKNGRIDIVDDQGNENVRLGNLDE